MPGFELTDRIAIVTGGSQGLGRATAVALAQAGADVVVVARQPEPVTSGRSRPHAEVAPVVDEIQGMGRRSLGITADVREADQVEHMVRAAEVFGITPIARIPDHADSTVLRFLDPAPTRRPMAPPRPP